ncbi:hypothetical protein ENU1_043960 [Entamoeba nuttalli P19]|uniref:Uncharacterized protein n=1 Tax=Entamoeba nuttalli (strain P19) TaxID=1076696 RepID=K2H2R7_ENTNP|nr:hypothetical protein ENU1_043960 [Entamoeba nuttalli P19]EKE41818.1 hypothetical protein ENU1_043960 [Entamoeba nuttalli P19]|eukprot:XP_008855858.1 hypothetical protein ENU1_043960 [Entamoeba nuttalli P19]
MKLISPFERKSVISLGNGVYEVALSQSEKQKDLLLAKRASTERDSAQQSFLFRILVDNGFTVCLKRLYKKGKTTSQLRNADAKTNDCLIKIASDYCWACFEFKKGKQSVVCSQMKRIQNAQIGSKIYGSNLILQEGKKMNQHILSIMSSHGCILSPQQSLVKC